MKVLALRGISGSGKSTYARELKFQGWAVVSRDDIRETVFKDYDSVDENAVTEIEDAAISALLKAGRNVVIDDTNIRLAYLKRFAALAAKFHATFDVKEVEADVNVAIGRVNSRASTGGRFVPEDVIRKQAQGLKSAKLNMEELYTPEFKEYVPNPDLPRAIMVDVDGTIAHNNGHRSFYEYEKVGDDEEIEAVAEIVRKFFSDGWYIIIMSGRDDNCQAATEEWMNNLVIPFDEMHMRKTGDQRKDSIVKIELFDEFVRDRFFVDFVLDDRQQVVDAWRSIGLRCLQVAPGNF